MKLTDLMPCLQFVRNLLIDCQIIAHDGANVMHFFQPLQLGEPCPTGFLIHLGDLQQAAILLVHRYLRSLAPYPGSICPHQLLFFSIQPTLQPFPPTCTCRQPLIWLSLRPNFLRTHASVLTESQSTFSSAHYFVLKYHKRFLRKKSGVFLPLHTQRASFRYKECLSD